MMESATRQLLETYEILAIQNRNALKFAIQGAMMVEGCVYDPEPHRHVMVETEVKMFGLPRNATLEEAINFFGWGLVKQVELVYMTSDVPDEIEWTGHIMIGLMYN